jgi:outer membrane cobalamin receptor
MKWALIIGLATPTLAWAEPTKETVTGSHIPREVQRIGRTTDSIAPVYVLDRTDIDRSGATSVGAVLRRVPFAFSGRGR